MEYFLVQRIRVGIEQKAQVDQDSGMATDYGRNSPSMRNGEGVPMFGRQVGLA